MPTAVPIFCLLFANQYLLTSTMLRFEEYYESPEFRGRVFTLEEFMDWYAYTHDGEFTYFTDWNGFNLPFDAFEPFRAGAFHPLTCKERTVLELTAGLPKPYYLIAMAEGENGVALHEIVHGLYYLFPEYAADVRSVLQRHDLAKMRRGLSKLGYHRLVHDDEINAYALTGLSHGLPRRGIARLHRDLKEVFSRHFGLDMDDADDRKRLIDLVKKIRFPG